jgi:hypothetical protein
MTNLNSLRFFDQKFTVRSKLNSDQFWILINLGSDFLLIFINFVEILIISFQGELEENVLLIVLL